MMQILGIKAEPERSVLKYVTDGDNAADDEDAHSGERKYAGDSRFSTFGRTVRIEDSTAT